MFLPSRRVQDGQEPPQQQQQGDSAWRQSPHLNDENDGGFGSYSATTTGSGTGLVHNILPSNHNYSSSSSFELHSRRGTLGSYSSSNTSYSLPSDMSSSCIDPQLTQSSIAYLTDMPPVASPDPTPLSPFLYQSGSATQATGYSTNQPSSYFDTYPNFQQYSITQGQQQAAIGLQEQGIYHNPGISGPMPSPHPPDHDVQQDTVAEHSNPALYVCQECGKGCTRQTDLDRHLKTTKKHSDPSGPACPESGCKYPSRFTRVDNFKAHYKNQHKKSGKEADEFIRQWRAQVNLGSPVGAPGRVWDNYGGRK